MQGALPLASPALDRLRHLQNLPNGYPAGGLPSLPSAYPLQFIFLPPIPPSPFPAGEGGAQGYFMQGASPLASPGLNLRFAAKPTEFLYLEQCRQPRRGGTGGDGTIRRTRRRRLRWSSPPGQIEQVPRWLAFFAACLPRLWLIFLPPIPPTPFPSGEGGDSKFISPGAEPPAPPGLNPGGTGAGGEPRTRRGCAFGIANSPQNRQNFFTLSGAGSQGEGGPGERNFGV